MSSRTRWRPGRRKASTSCGKKQLTLGHYFGLSACEKTNDPVSNVISSGKKKSLRLSLEKRNQLDIVSNSKETEGTGTHVSTKRKSFSVQQCICKSEKTKDSGPSGKKSFRLSLRRRKQCISNTISQGCSERNLCRNSGLRVDTGNENCAPGDVMPEDMTEGYSFSQKLTLSNLEEFITTPRDSHSVASLPGIESPRKILYSSSPELTRPGSASCQDTGDHENVLLFSTPSWLPGSVSPKPEHKKVAKPAHGPGAETHVDGSEYSFKECSFREDISWSKFLNDSRVDATSRNKINRYLVLEVISQNFVDAKDTRRTELVLRLREERLKTEKICRLRDDWLGTDVAPGDIVQVNAVYDVGRSCYIVDSTPDASIIVEPDTLLTASSIANSFACTRKSVFADKFKGSVGNKAMLFGQMLHKIFQATLTKCQEVGVVEVLREVVMEEVRSTLTSLESLDQLYGLDMSEAKALEELTEYVPAVVEWCCNFLCSEPQHGAGDIEFERAGDSVKKSCVCVTDVVDIEENIWSPRFGLKGKVDVTVTLKEKRGAGEVVVTKRMPLELKTGKMHYSQGTNEHRAQVILYGLMMSDRYPNQPQRGGLLLYLKDKHMQGLPFNAQDKRGLLMARNDLARYVSGHSVSLPAMVKDQHVCKYCPYLKQCALCQRSLENGTEGTEDLGKLFSAQISHLATSHLEFFGRWFGLLEEEEQCCRASQSNAPWLSSAHEREREGLSLADMLALPPTFFKSTGRYLQSFTKQLDAMPSSSGREVSLCSNDRVVISAQDGSGWAIAMGTVTEVLPGEGVGVTLDKAVPFKADGVLYRIDRMSGSGGGIAYSNLADMCTSDGEREHRLRELIIDGSAPVFGPDVDVSEESLIALNSDQKAVIRKVLAAKDYILVHGMPGTKTTTIAHLVQTLVSRGKTILLTSYTHSAVDSILFKLVKIGVPFVRLGPPSRIHPSLQSAMPIHLCRDVRSVKQLEQFYDSQSVVATTCLGVASHPVFSRRVFDVCIVDEASQITLPNVLGPLRHAHTFLLVGDHYQLPPLVRSQKAREGGLAVSLFQTLSEGHPAALISLEKQYRMNT